MLPLLSVGALDAHAHGRVISTWARSVARSAKHITALPVHARHACRAPCGAPCVLRRAPTHLHAWGHTAVTSALARRAPIPTGHGLARKTSAQDVAPLIREQRTHPRRASYPDGLACLPCWLHCSAHCLGRAPGTPHARVARALRRGRRCTRWRHTCLPHCGFARCSAYRFPQEGPLTKTWPTSLPCQPPHHAHARTTGVTAAHVTRCAVRYAPLPCGSVHQQQPERRLNTKRSTTHMPKAVWTVVAVSPAIRGR
jgi:hypothetical protein